MMRNDSPIAMIYRRLRRGAAWTLEELSLGLEGRDVRQMIKRLRMMGLRIEYDRETKRYRYVDAKPPLPPEAFLDEIEVAGVVGTVKRMSLVSTTILTADNQTLIVPNSAVWGGVIRNQTMQPNRRVRGRADPHRCNIRTCRR